MDRSSISWVSALALSSCLLCSACRARTGPPEPGVPDPVLPAGLDRPEGSGTGEQAPGFLAEDEESVRIRPIPWVGLPIDRASFLVTNATDASVFFRGPRPTLHQQLRPPLAELLPWVGPWCCVPRRPASPPVQELPSGASMRVECSLSYLEARMGFEFWRSAEGVPFGPSQLAWSDWFRAPRGAQADILARHIQRQEHQEGGLDRWRRVRDRSGRVPTSDPDS